MNETPRNSWLSKLRQGLGRSANSLGENISGLFKGRKLDDESLEELEDLLIAADLGVETAQEVSARLAKTRFEENVSTQEIRQALADVVAEVLRPVEAEIAIDSAHKPHVLLMVGVNGTGKTTTIGKLAHQFLAGGRSVMLAAGDTFRAAAIEQLQAWGRRNNVDVVSGPVGGDPASVAFEAMQRARDARTDVLLIDTAGRLQNKADLMAQLEKIIRVIRKQDETAPHDTILVLDATSGQNVLRQVEVFSDVADTTGLIMTKLDGTAKGGVLVACARKFGLPVHAVGIGEDIDDLQPFNADAFARALAGAGDAV